MFKKIVGAVMILTVFVALTVVMIIAMGPKETLLIWGLGILGTAMVAGGIKLLTG